MSCSSPRRRLHRLPALFLTLTLALPAGPVYALPARDRVPALPAPSPLAMEAGPAKAYLACRNELASLGLDLPQIRTLWGRMGDDLLPALESGKLSPEELPYLSLPYFRADKLERCLALVQANPELTPEEAAVSVNMGLDQDFYTGVEELPAPADPQVLVNKYRALPADYIPDLTRLDPAYGAGSLTPEAALAFVQMADAARADGISLRSVSAYRSYATQDALYRRYVAQSGQELADTFSARPGHSEHQTGLALDINTASIRDHFEDTEEFAWLQANCAQYGFLLRYPEGRENITGYRFEPWHYRYVGEEIAQTCMEQGLTYEEYTAQLPVAVDNQLPALSYGGETLTVDGLMLEEVPYLSARDLALQLGWSADRTDFLLSLTTESRTLTLRPGRSFFRDGVPQRLANPALELDGNLYLSLSDLCAALGLELEPTDEGLMLGQPLIPLPGIPFL